MTPLLEFRPSNPPFCGYIWNGRSIVMWVWRVQLWIEYFYLKGKKK